MRVGVSRLLSAPPPPAPPLTTQLRAGAKGMGLFAVNDIKAGDFIIEYIGEVLEEEEYLRRKDFYAQVRHACRHTCSLQLVSHGRDARTWSRDPGVQRPVLLEGWHCDLSCPRV